MQAPRSIAILCGLGFPAYFLFMAIPQLGATSYWAALSNAYASSVRNWQIAGAIALMGSATLLVAFRCVRIQISWYTSIPIAGLAAYLTASSLWSLNPPDTFLYSILFLVILLCCATYWLMPEDISRSIAFLSFAGCLFGLALLFSRLPIGTRSVGGVGANLLAHFGLALIVLAYLGTDKWRPLAIAIGIGLIVFSQGRTLLIGATLFFISYHGLTAAIRDQRSLLRVGAISIAAAIFVALLAPAAIALVSDWSSSLLGIRDTARLGNSGFSGRYRSWELAFDIMRNHEVFGFGYRTRGSTFVQVGSLSINAHSGLLNAVLDLGILGFLAFISTYLYSITRLLIAWSDAKCDSDRISASFLIGMLPVLAVEPNYLNFASPTHFLLVLCLASPMVIRSNSVRGRVANRGRPTGFAERPAPSIGSR